MPRQHFNIEHYEIIKGDIVVMIERDSIGIPITIPQDKFELFLLTERKLILPLEYADDNGKEKHSVKITYSEYLEMDRQDIEQDLYQYIISNPITYHGVIFENSLTSIKLAFDLHNAKRVVFNTRWEHDQEIFKQVFN